MTTLIDTIIPNRQYIVEVLNTALTSDLDEDKYTQMSIKNIAGLIVANPAHYAMFGPWWPAIKKLIIGTGDTTLGQTYPEDIAEIYTYDRPALTLIAGVLYSNERLIDHVVTDSYHFLPVMPSADDTDPYLYESYDESLDKYKIDQVL